MKPLIIQSSVFKAKCLQLMDEVSEHHFSIVITKHGKAVAKLVPIDEQPQVEFFGCLKNTVKIVQDIVKPIDESWESNE